MVEVTALDIQSLTPALDPRKHGKIHITAGRNFKFDLNGPSSGFGTELLSGHEFTNVDHIQGIKVDIRTGPMTLTFTDDAILEWVESVGDFVVRYFFPSTKNEPYRWTFGYLNDYIYLCHPSVGLLAYDVTSQRVEKLQTPIAKPIACCVDNGRLIQVDALTYSWSVQSDGHNFTQLELGGAGTQKIQDRTPGKVISCESYGQGVLTFTTGGIMRSSFTGDNAVYRHRNVVTDTRPINSFCIIRQAESQIIILDRQGFFSSNGDIPVPYSPLFSEYIKARLRAAYLSKDTNIRLDWDRVNETIYVSFSATEHTPTYTKSFALYAPLDKWGTYDETHTGFFPVDIISGTRMGEHLAVLKGDKLARIFTRRGFREMAPTNPTANLYRPLNPIPSQTRSDGLGQIMSATCRCSSVNEAASEAMLPNAGVAGYYTWDGMGKLDANVTGLDSLIRMGLFRLFPEQAVDFVAEVQDVTIGSYRSLDPSDVNYADWNISGSDNDWNQGTQIIDYGDLSIDSINYDVNLIGTNDGRTAYNSEVPTLSHSQESQRFYTCTVTAVWHMIEVAATIKGDYYHVNYIGINGIPAGRLI